MAAPAPPRAPDSAKGLTVSAYFSFVPIGIVTVLIGPMLPAALYTRWSLNYAQGGTLMTTQYVASTIAVAVSGMLASRRGFRFPITLGLVLTAVGVAVLLAGSRILGMAAIATYGFGMGIAVPAANLVVAEVNPQRRSAALNVLNFCWSVGSVACPFLVAFAAKHHRLPFLLGVVAASCLLVAAGIVAVPSASVKPAAPVVDRKPRKPVIDWKHGALPALGALFFVYVGTENAFGMWVASYAKSLGTMAEAAAVRTPSFFYIALMIGRWLAPTLLRKIAEIRLAETGLLVAAVGMAGLVWSHEWLGVAVSASLAGLGLSCVYPITIALLSREFGSAATRVGSVMFTLSNLGGSVLPLVVGAASSHFGTLKAGLAVPLIGAVIMSFLYRRDWEGVDAQLT